MSRVMHTADVTNSSLESIAGEVLTHLCRALDVADLCYACGPERILGGFETLILGCSLSGEVPSDLRGDLVIRVLPEPGGAAQGRKEAVFHNAVTAAGFPAPKVVFQGGDRTVAGRAFNIMERAPGYPMIKALLDGSTENSRIATQLARIHARLHDTPSSGVAAAIEAAGLAPGAVSIDGQLRSVRRYGDEPGLECLRPCADWLRDNQPPGHTELRVCHGDLHPGNVMVKSGVISGVLDWSAAQVAHPEYDLASLVVVVGAAFSEIVIDATPEMTDAFTAQFLDAYGNNRDINANRLNYYQALRSFRAFARGCAACIPGIDSRLQPREHYPWAKPRAMRVLASVLSAATGLPVQVPGNIDL